MTWTNVPRAQAGSAQSHLGFFTTTSRTSAPAGMSLTRCEAHAWILVEITPQSGQPSSWVSESRFNPVPAIQAGSANVGRSAATYGAQRVDIQTYLYLWDNGGWRHIQSSVTSWAVTFTGITSRLYGSYRVTMNVYWRDANTLRNLGARAFVMNHGSDYWCQTSGNVRCSTSAGGYIDVW